MRIQGLGINIGGHITGAANGYRLSRCVGGQACGATVSGGSRIMIFLDDSIRNLFSMRVGIDMKIVVGTGLQMSK